MLYLWGSAIMHVTYTEMKYTYSTIYSSVTIQWEHRIVDSGENGDTLRKIVAFRIQCISHCNLFYMEGHHTGDNITYHILMYNDMMPGKS